MKLKFPLFLLIGLNLLVLIANAQNDSVRVDSLEFPLGFPGKTRHSALQQLTSFPAPRYATGHDFHYLFDWMNPDYLGGKGQNEVSPKDVVRNGVAIQKELAFHWNYNIVISNTVMAYNDDSYNDKNRSYNAYVQLANEFPQIPLGVITFWQQIRPNAFGYKAPSSNVHSQALPPENYISDPKHQLKNKRISFAANDSLFSADGKIQRLYLENILKHLTRPIDMINENGEEQPMPVISSVMKSDSAMLQEMTKLKTKDWKEYMSIKKRKFRLLYKSQFMDSLPQLKNTAFTMYQIDAGPIDRFDWNMSKSICSKINGNYYGTPDLYPQIPKNWKISAGPWHGWNWFEKERPLEIKAGDLFFSPFIAAGWDKDPTKDIRPAQWLGLLKCANIIGAEFFYTGYFSLQKPFPRSEDYIWQAVVPAYAQAIATHYREIFRNGNVLMDEKNEPIITYPQVLKNKNTLVTVRKQNDANCYAIATTIQTFSNINRTPLKAITCIYLGNHYLRFETRRQGSVYIYDNTVSPPLFYQLDRWQEASHPERWRTAWIQEAEVPDSASVPATQLIHTAFQQIADTLDFTTAQSFILLNRKQAVRYDVDERDLQRSGKNHYLHIYACSQKKIKLSIGFDGHSVKLKHSRTGSWQWLLVQLPAGDATVPVHQLLVLSKKKGLQIDRFVVDSEAAIPSLESY